jgi:hypothetical protein
MMSFAALGLPAFLWISITSLALLNARNWRSSMISLSLQYIGVFVLVGISWPLESAVAKLVSGGMACIVLGIASSERNPAGFESWQISDTSWPSGRAFRTMAAGLVWLTVFSLASKAASWIPGIGIYQVWAALILIGMGLLQLGFTAQPLRVVIGLLTTLSGFEILYSAVESSALLTGLLSAVTLGLALVGAYLLSTENMEEDE